MQRVTTAVIRCRNKILIAKRKPGKHMGSKWEFPGGKVEQGESTEQCIKRELQEEFSVQTQELRFICQMTFVNKDVQLDISVYFTKILGELILHEHEEICWVSVGELKNYDLVESDFELARKIAEGSLQ